MKRIAMIVVMVLLSLGTSARSIHYFTYSQAARTVSYLNSQREIMIYCGYDYEIETYVLVNEIWMERVNSSYYEIWVYGFDAYTGDEIYMPLDLQCVWLFSTGRIYNAAQYLRFRIEVRTPSLVWHIPPYNPYTRIAHPHGYTRTYHYDIHRHGWMPPAYTYSPGVNPPLPHSYMRRPNTPAPRPTTTWSPGTNRPQVAPPTQSHLIGNTSAASNPSANSASHNSSTTRNVGNNPTTPPSSSRNNTSTTPSRNNSTTPSRTSTSTTPARTTTSTTPTRTNTTTTPSRSTTTTTTTPSRNNTTTTTPSRNNTTTTPSRTTTTTTPTRNTTTTTPSRTTTTTTPTRTTSTRTPARSNTLTTPSRSSASQAPSRTSTPTRK